MDLYTEIRKLSPGHLYSLVQILEFDESWKKLMAVIPKNLTLENFECKITINNLPKYNTDHFKLIDTAGYKQRRPCAEILLEEWGSSGRIRPRLGHLITLLKKTELLRAADYVAMELLKMPEVDRPESGPAKKVDIPKDNQLIDHSPKQNSTKYPSSFLDGDAIPTSIINELMNPPQHVIPTIIVNTPEDNKLYYNPIQNNNKKISNTEMIQRLEHFSVSNEDNAIVDDRNTIVTGTVNGNTQNINGPVNNNFENNMPDNIPAFSTLLEQDGNIVETINTKVHHNSVHSNQGQQKPTMSHANNPSSPKNELPAFSDIFISPNSPPSQNNNSNYMPDFSMLKSNTESSNIPALSILNNSEDIIPTHDSNYIPKFSDILNSEASYLPALSQIMNSEPIVEEKHNSVIKTEDNLPAFSRIMKSELSTSELPQFDELLQNDRQPNLDLPVISDLLPSSPANELSPSSPAPSVQSNSSRTCASPLPNLTLNTVLPHFTYQELELRTESFDETILSTQDSKNLNQVARFGRKLGSGAFGSVYLAIGLLDKPVAVKKLNLNGVNVVNIDDTVTKQFRNEVELLCKYKHDNLLSLLGYSCDGPTYCLIYEYICGGALKDRLQSSLKLPEDFRLLWTDRMYIALGAAKAVSYLHNAHSMPLIHRDIKSANILLDNLNKPKLCDFGLIKLTPNPNTNTSTTVFGTSAYMAPEAFRGDVSVKLDTFSFGVVLLELLTSLPPLDENREGNDLVTHVEEVCEDDIKPLLDMNAGSWFVNNVHFGDALYDIATQCLEEKKRRPVMSEVVKQLSELLSKTS